MIFAYARVSAADRKTDRQESAIYEYCEKNNIKIDRFFIDTASGKDFKRAEYQELKDSLHSGDTIIIKELDRLGRNMLQIKQEWLYFQQNNISVIIIDTPTLNTVKQENDLDTTLISNVIFELLSYMAKKEKFRIKQRQSEGIVEAKKRGTKLGRPSLEYPENWKSVYSKWKNGEIVSVDAMEQLNLKKTSFYKLVRLYEGRE